MPRRAPSTPHAALFLLEATTLRERVLGALELHPAGPLYGVGIAQFPTALHRDCKKCMSVGAVNVLVAHGAPREHVLPEYGLAWVGRKGLVALESTRDLLHGNDPDDGPRSERVCFGAFEEW